MHLRNKVLCLNSLCLFLCKWLVTWRTLKFWMKLTVKWEKYKFSFIAPPSPPLRNNPPVGQGLFIIEYSGLHSDPQHSVGLLWTNDQAYAKTSTWQHITLTINNHGHFGIQTHNLRKRAAADPRLRPRGHWHRFSCFIVAINFNFLCIFHVSFHLGVRKFPFTNSSCVVKEFQVNRQYGIYS